MVLGEKVSVSNAHREAEDKQRVSVESLSPHPEDMTPNSAPPLLPRISAASLGSIVTALAVTPLEVVKVRQQLSLVRSCPECGSTVILHNGLMECMVSRSCFSQLSYDKNLGTIPMLRQIFQREGFKGIYAGLTPTLVMSVPSTIFYYSAYDEISANLRLRWWDSAWVPLVSGSSARLLATVVTSPLELIRTQQASSSSVDRNFIRHISTLIREEGISCLYKGLVPTLWRDVPFSAVYWFFLEYFKAYFERSYRRFYHTQRETVQTALIPPHIQTMQTFSSGAVSGMIAATVTTPFDVVKTRQQTSKTANPSIFWQFRHIFITQGIPGLMTGNTARILKVAPACAIMISCYDLGKRMFS